MARGKPFVRNVRYDISAECSLCGDTLLAGGISAASNALETLYKRLEQLFERHIAEKHPAKEK
jgi:hypothetical protein